jgi:hypothetical protein
LGHNTIFREKTSMTQIIPHLGRDIVILAGHHTFHLLDLALIPVQGMYDFCGTKPC